jgi:hypothetical protein
MWQYRQISVAKIIWSFFVSNFWMCWKENWKNDSCFFPEMKFFDSWQYILY